jgi:hypothetical protein
MLRLTTLGRSSLGCIGSNLLSKHVNNSLTLDRSRKKTMELRLVQDTWRVRGSAVGFRRLVVSDRVKPVVFLISAVCPRAIGSAT